MTLSVKSPVDGRLMSGIESLRVHSATDYVSGTGHVIRWTELFFISQSQSADGNGESNEARTPEDPADASRLADQLAQALCLALTPHLQALAFVMLTKIGLRVTVGIEQVRDYSLVSLLLTWSHWQDGCHGNTLSKPIAAATDLV